MSAPKEAGVVSFVLGAKEHAELLLRRDYFPFREWYAVKTESGEVEYFDSKGKATQWAKKHAPAAIWAAVGKEPTK